VYSRKKGNRELFVSEMGGLFKQSLIPKDDAADAMAGADIVVTATSATAPLFHEEQIEEGMLIASLGAPTEVDPKVLAKARVVVEGAVECKTHGKWGEALKLGLINEGDLQAELVDVIAGKKEGRTEDGQVIFLDCVGMAIEDTMVASRVYDEAVKRGIGSDLGIFDGMRLWQ